MVRSNILYDRYHHCAASEWLSDFTVTGKFVNNLGRYGLSDNYHTNGYFNLLPILNDRCVFEESWSPITYEVLSKCDILLIANPDYQLYYPPIPGPRFEDAEIKAIHDFVARGGSLILMINSYLPSDESYMWKENYNIDDANKILEPYGIRGGHHISGNSELCDITENDNI